jgi:transcription elongation factor Elf1
LERISTKEEMESKEEIKPVRVQWSISADIECPHCNHDNDFMDVDEWYNFTKPGENVEKFHYDVGFTCEECGKEFKINGADY